MEMIDGYVCSICSKAFCSSERIAVQDFLKILKFLFTKINCSALQNTKICERCSESIHQACNFKMLYVEKKPLNITIKIEQISDPEISCICQICKQVIKKSSSVSITKVLKLIDYLVEEMQMEFEATEDSHICISCQESVVNFHSVVKLFANFVENVERKICIDQLIDPSTVEIKEEPLMEHSNITNEYSMIKNEPMETWNIKNDIKTELTYENDESFTYEEFIMKNEEFIMKNEEFIMKNEEMDIKSECEESGYTEQIWKVSEERNTINTSHVAPQHFNIDHKNNKKAFSTLKIPNTIDIASDIGLFTCDMCDHKTKWKGNLKIHMLKHTNLADIEMFTCDLCDYKAKRKDQLNRHMLKHKNLDEIKIFTCDVCDYKAIRKENLKIHMLKHGNVVIKMFACDVCDYKSKRKDDLKMHMLKHRNVEIKMFACDVSDYKAKQKDYFQIHMMKHENVEIKMFACNVCDYKAKRKDQLNSHMLKHKNVDEINMFACDVCDYKAKRKGQLNRHTLKHKNLDEIKIFKCDVCDYKAKRKNNLKIHMLKHNSKIHTLK